VLVGLGDGDLEPFAYRLTALAGCEPTAHEVGSLSIRPDGAEGEVLVVAVGESSRDVDSDADQKNPEQSAERHPEPRPSIHVVVHDRSLTFYTGRRKMCSPGDRQGMSIIRWLCTTRIVSPLASLIRFKQWETPNWSGLQRVSVSTTARIRC
jgi:hypothetical protein